MEKRVQKTPRGSPLLKLSFYCLLFLLYSPLSYSFTTSVQFSVGATSYNNNFYLESDEKKKRYKMITKNIFSPLFQVSWDVYLWKKWRVGFTGAFRTTTAFTTPETTLFKDHSLRIQSSLATSALEFHILYQVLLDTRSSGYFGLATGYSEHWLGQWSSEVKTPEGFYKQTLQSYHHPVFFVKMIVGRDFHLSHGFFLDLALHFSFIETTYSSDQKKSDNYPKDKVGVWKLSAPYQFPSRPLDITLGLRKNISF